MKKINICPEYSAQGTRSKPNPLFRLTLEKLTTDNVFNLRGDIKLVDFGCGKLRHLDICREFSKQIVLVDTKYQIERVQKFSNSTCKMSEYIESLQDNSHSINIVNIDEFEKQTNDADLIFCTAVMDAVTKTSRVRIAKAAFRNLNSEGYFVVIVPRNDSSILVNCHDDNKFEDGFIFKNRGHDKLTFYANFRDSKPLLEVFKKIGFILVEDDSSFRQVCFILRKPFQI